MKDINCPYCKEEIDIDHDNGQGYEEDVLHEQQCSECNKEFVYSTAKIFVYYPAKADCLNEGEHVSRVTDTYPKFLSVMKCKSCDHIRDLTEQEKIDNNIPLSWNDEFRKKEEVNPKDCLHENISSEDGLDECLGCGVKNY